MPFLFICKINVESENVFVVLSSNGNKCNVRVRVAETKFSCHQSVQSGGNKSITPRTKINVGHSLE